MRWKNVAVAIVTKIIVVVVICTYRAVHITINSNSFYSAEVHVFMIRIELNIDMCGDKFVT